jgi:hypothetical protein
MAPIATDGAKTSAPQEDLLGGTRIVQPAFPPIAHVDTAAAERGRARIISAAWLLSGFQEHVRPREWRNPDERRGWASQVAACTLAAGDTPAGQDTLDDIHKKRIDLAAPLLIRASPCQKAEDENRRSIGLQLLPRQRSGWIPSAPRRKCPRYRRSHPRSRRQQRHRVKSSLHQR